MLCGSLTESSLSFFFPRKILPNASRNALTIAATRLRGESCAMEEAKDARATRTSAERTAAGGNRLPGLAWNATRRIADPAEEPTSSATNRFTLSCTCLSIAPAAPSTAAPAAAAPAIASAGGAAGPAEPPADCVNLISFCQLTSPSAASSVFSSCARPLAVFGARQEGH